MKLSREEMQKIVDEAPEGANYWAGGSGCNYRRVSGGAYFGWIDGGWEDTHDKELSKYRISNSFFINDLISELATETPEEKEALDNIKVAKVDDKQSVKVETEHQKEMAEFGWDGEGLPPVGVECEVYGALGKYDEWQECEVFAIKHCDVFMSNEKEWVVRSKDDVKFRKIETEAEKLERERLEGAYDLYESAQYEIGCIGYDSFELFKKSKVQVKFWLAIVDKTNYRKGGVMSFSKLKRDRKAKVKNKNARHLTQKCREAHHKGVKVSSLTPSKTYRQTLYK